MEVNRLDLMKRILTIHSAALTLLFVFALLPAQAQTLTLLPESKLWVAGTSNKSDWTVDATEVKAEMAATADAINNVKVTVASAKVVSNKSSIMDRLIHDALKVSEHPTITYDLSEAVKGVNGKTFSTKTKGKLTLAGVTKAVDITVSGERLDGGKLRLKGSTPLKMTDFGITPPSAMFGALRTANDVTVHFDITVAPAATSGK